MFEFDNFSHILLAEKFQRYNFEIFTFNIFNFRDNFKCWNYQDLSKKSKTLSNSLKTLHWSEILRIVEPIDNGKTHIETN